MRKLLHILALCLLSFAASAQCDTLGVLLELQATTNMSGVIFAKNKCLTTLTIQSPLYTSNDTLYIDTTGLGGGGSGTVLSVAATAPTEGFTITGSPITTSGTFVFALANDLAAIEALTGTGIAARTATSTWALRTLAAGTGISITNADGASGNPTITNTGDLSTSNEVQTYSHAGTTTYINTLSLGGGSFTLQSGGIASISHTAGTVTISATEAQIANNGLSDNEGGGGVFRLGNRYMNSSDGLFSFDRKINLNAFRLFIGDNTDSTLLHIDGTNDRVGVRTTAPGRSFTVNGEMEVKDLITTTPDRIVGADGNGVFSEITIGSNITLSGGILSATGGSFYQTFRDDGAAATQQPVANFVSTGRISTLLTNDGPNTETEVSLDIVANSIGNTQLRQGIARSVVGVTGNATANLADIQGTADQVLRVNTAGTALAFGTVATGGIADDAVTLLKLQNAVANNIVLGNISGAGAAYAELTVTNLYTLLGLVGTANRFALWTGTQALTSDAAFTFDGPNDRATFTGTVTGTGANTGILNLNTGALGAATTFLRMSGNVSSNMIAEIVNSNNATTAANAIFTNSVGGASAGDPIHQFNINGVTTWAIGLDNDGGDRFKITNAATPGGTVNFGVIIRDNAGQGNTGINKDFPGMPLDGPDDQRARFGEWIGPGGNLLTSANITFGTGAGTGPSVGAITGANNYMKISFNTGTTPTANANIFTFTYPTAFPTFSCPVFIAGNNNAATDITKFYINANPAASFTIKANGTLAASTNYVLFFSIWGY